LTGALMRESAYASELAEGAADEASVLSPGDPAKG
jgi:hypothetical protein